jgi:Tol biopolymer transport system component
VKRFLGGIGAALYVVACILPAEPSGTEGIEFQFDFALPYRVPLAGTAEPTLSITAGGRALRNPHYRLESLDQGIVRVDGTGRGLEGAMRGTASIRVVYQTAAATVDTVFLVQVVVSRVAVDSPELAFTRLGARRRLRAMAFDAQDAAVPNVPFTWSSANPQVATVDDTGLVAAVNEGTVVIAAKADSVEGFATVVVTQVASQVLLAPTIDTLRTVGRSIEFFAIAFDDSGRVQRLAKPRWSSRDTNVARVDSAGIATATGGGTTQIVARVGTAADTATLVVKQVVAFVRVPPGIDTLTAIQDTGRIVATVYDSGGAEIPNSAVTWATSDPTVATVNPTGLVTAAANGVTLVTATSEGLSGFATVVVRQQVAAARLSQDNVALTGPGDTVRLSAAGFDRNGHAVVGAAFTWRTGSWFVATVNSSGLVTARGGGSTSITATPTDGGTSGAATVTVMGAPQSPVIVFDSPRGIEIMVADGTQRSMLIQNPPATLYSEPSWSPDGTRLAFIRNRCDVVTAQVDGSDLRVVNGGAPAGTPCNSSPAWSPDGTRIAFTKGDCWDYETAVYVANADGSNLFRLTTGWCAFDPTWSPDGNKLAFADEWGGISVMNSNGTDFRRLIDQTYNGGLDQPAWSPDGTQIAFVEAYGDPNTVHGAIWVMNADGSGAQNLTGPVTQAAYNRNPVWSPDGSFIAFARSSAFRDSDLYIMARDGTGLQRLTTTLDAFNPAWRVLAPAASARRVALPRAKATPRSRLAPER